MLGAPAFPNFAPALAPAKMSCLPAAKKDQFLSLSKLSAPLAGHWLNGYWEAASISWMPVLGSQHAKAAASGSVSAPNWEGGANLSLPAFFVSFIEEMLKSGGGKKLIKEKLILKLMLLHAGLASQSPTISHSGELCSLLTSSWLRQKTESSCHFCKELSELLKGWLPAGVMGSRPKHCGVLLERNGR